MTTLFRLAGRAASHSRSRVGKAAAAAPSGLVSFAQRRGAFQGAGMETGGGKGGRGALVVLEGLDRSGKSSQCARLLSFLKGKGCNVEGWRFPDRTTSVGQMISAYLANESQLDDRTVHLLFSANRWEKRGLMESKLLSGTTLVVDRYSHSGVAFSASKGLDIDWCKAPENGLIAPDLVIYLDVQPEKAAERGGYGDERYEKIEFQKKVAEHYLSLRDSTWKVTQFLQELPEKGLAFALPLVPVNQGLEVLPCVNSSDSNCKRDKFNTYFVQFSVILMICQSYIFVCENRNSLTGKNFVAYEVLDYLF